MAGPEGRQRKVENGCFGEVFIGFELETCLFPRKFQKVMGLDAVCDARPKADAATAVGKRPRGFLKGAAMQKQHNSDGRCGGIGQVREHERELAVQYETVAKQHQQQVQQLEKQLDAMRAQRQALSAKAQTEERAKTDELEQALAGSHHRLQELSRHVQEAATAAATALEKTEASNSKTPTAADQLLQCLGDALGVCPNAPAPFMWTIKQQQDHASHFGAASPPPRRCPGCRTQWRNRKQWDKHSAQIAVGHPG